MEKTTMYYFDVFEQKAIEARKILYSIYFETDKFEKENSKFVDMSPTNFFGWKINQVRIIEAKGGNCRRYLEYFSKGYFESCAQILDEGWETKPSLINDQK